MSKIVGQTRIFISGWETNLGERHLLIQNHGECNGSYFTAFYSNTILAMHYLQMLMKRKLWRAMVTHENELPWISMKKF